MNTVSIAKNNNPTRLAVVPQPPKTNDEEVDYFGNDEMEEDGSLWNFYDAATAVPSPVSTEFALKLETQRDLLIKESDKNQFFINH